MSIQIIKAGILDSLQGLPDTGKQHQGFSPGGAMDMVAHAVANALVGNKRDATTLEMHIPGAEIVFLKETIFAFTGAASSAILDNETIYANQPIIVNAGSNLSFNTGRNGARIYIAVHGGFKSKKGRLLKNDILNTDASFGYHFEGVGQLHALTLGWTANTKEFYRSNIIRCIQGPDFNVLSKQEIDRFQNKSFEIDLKSNRMGFRLNSEPISHTIPTDLLSTAVTRGTLQLTPAGQLIVLMADHQTTGGYPRIGTVISADMASLAQLPIGSSFEIRWISIEEAEVLLLQQETNLQQLENACKFRLQEYFSEK
jgi:antagonist of KipI